MSDSSDTSDFEDFVDYLYDNQYEYPARQYLRDADNPMEAFDNDQFLKRYRFKKETVVNVLLPLTGLAQKTTNRGLPIPRILELLMALRFYAIGNFQIVCGDMHKLSQSVVSRIVTKISKALAGKLSLFIKFPDANEQAEVKRSFYRRAHFPGVIGCIDCTHIPIRNNGELYRNGKGDFSINVQIVCGPGMKVYDIVARWPGSAHDSRIFSNSRCCLQLEEGDLAGAGIILGDSGYAQTSYMFTPVLNPQTVSQERYNRTHISTRNVIERVNGFLKRRFPCLARKLQNKINNIPNIIVECAVLHNICISTNTELPEEQAIIDIPVPLAPAREMERGSIIRANFIERHFT